MSAGPGRGGGAIDVDSGTTGGDEHHAALAGGDQRRRIEDGGDPHLRGSPGARSEAQLEGDLRAVRPDHTVDVAGCDAGIGECSQCARQGNGGRVVLRQDAGLHRVVDADDGHVGEGV